MTKLNLKSTVVVVVVALLAFIAWNVRHMSAPVSTLLGANECASGQTCLPSLELTGPNSGVTNAFQIDAGSTSITGALALTGNFTLTGSMSVSATSTMSGAVIFDSSQMTSFTNSTTTSANAESIFENDIAPGGKCYGTFSLAQVRTSSAPATTTISYLATSTFANMIPSVGDSCTQRIESATSSASNPGIILAFGSGWKPQTASTTPTGLTINGGAYAIVTYVRQFSSDIAALITIYKSAN